MVAVLLLYSCFICVCLSLSVFNAFCLMVLLDWSVTSVCGTFLLFKCLFIS